MTKISLHRGDNRDSLRRLIEQGVRVHSVVTDPPYGLVSIQKRFGKEGSAPAKFGTDGAFARASKGFMGSIWDGTGIERDPEFWALIYEILLPGGYVFAFSGSRTGHWQACAMEMAGFIMHPMHGWVFGCMDTETECLTRRGWLAYTDLLPTDEVLQWDSVTDSLSWVIPEHVHEYDFDGQMVQIKNRHTHQVLTPNHRVYAKVRRHSRHPKPTDYEVVEAREVHNRPGNWQVNLPMASTLYQSECVVDPSFAYLVGSWLTDAWHHKDANACCFSQSKPATLVKLRAALEGLGASEYVKPAKKDTHNDEHTFYLTGPIADRLRTEFPDRALGWGVLGWNIEARHALYEGLMDGDGSRNKPGQIAEAFWSQKQDRRDVFLALALSIGIRCYEDPVKGVVYVNPKTRTTQVQGKQRAEPLPYKGKVWCLTVPTGAFVVRRSGRPFITGNSGFPKAHAADKAIDKHLGVNGTYDGVKPGHGEFAGRTTKGHIDFKDATDGFDRPWMHDDDARARYHMQYAPGSPEAAEWDGWAYGTQAQKPALENIYLGQKPIDNVDIFLRLVHNALQSVLESQLCQQKVCGTALLSSVSIAEVITTLKNHGLLEANIAQNLARLRLAPGNMDQIGAVENISALTDTLLSELTINTSSNTALSWLALLVATWSLGNTFTTAITSEMITDLKTWNSLIGRNIRENTTLLSELTGSGSAVAIAEKCLKRACVRLLSQISAIATESAIEQLALLETDQEAGKKPALEPIYLGQKPFSEKTGAANLLKHGVGAVNIDATRVPLNGSARSGGIMGDSEPRGAWEATKEGRHPSNLILDGSPEVVAMFPDSKGQQGAVRGDEPSGVTKDIYGKFNGRVPAPVRGDSGSAARFFHQFGPDADPLFYHAKAGKSDRAGSKHPTVKPIALMQYLIRHITPPGGVILDPFAGSGTTAEAAKREGFDCILMEAESEYIEFLESRFNLRRSTDLTDLLS